MLTLSKRRRRIWLPIVIISVVLLLIAGGLYVASIFVGPAIDSYSIKPINPESLQKPMKGQDQIIIPKIGVSLPYGTNVSALETGALWVKSDKGNPVNGGNFIIAAVGFKAGTSYQDTIDKSPFYSLDKLSGGDQILVDYQGKRYLYTINKSFTDIPSQAEIEASSDTAKLTVYSAKEDGGSDGKVVVTATREGEVAID